MNAECLWDKDQMDAAEAAFRDTLLDLRGRAAKKSEIARAVARSPFIRALVTGVTAKRYAPKLVTRFGGPPAGWKTLMERLDLLGDWRAVTVELVEKKCERYGLLGCDLTRPRIGGFWRSVVVDKAVKAAEMLTRRWSRQKKTADGRTVRVRSVGVKDSGLPDKNEPVDSLETQDLQRCVRRAIDSLTDAWDKAVVELFLEVPNKRKVAALLTARLGREVTYDEVRGAFKRVGRALREYRSIAELYPLAA